MNLVDASDILIEQEITKVMLELGIPAHLRGYHCIRCAVVITVRDMDAVTSVTKLLYPVVARALKTTDTKVERCIRNAIEVSWERGNEDVEKRLFGYSRIERFRPTNSEYIARLADYIRLLIKAMD